MNTIPSLSVGIYVRVVKGQVVVVLIFFSRDLVVVRLYFAVMGAQSHLVQIVVEFVG
jgi:hypothetical protein